MVSVARYLRRMTGRPTPSGLLAGVAPATFGNQPHMRWGAGHRAVARADAAWVADVIRQVEGCPEALERLAVVANSTVMVRGDHLIVPHQQHAVEQGTSAVEVSMRHTDAVRAAVEAARKPVRLAQVVEELVATFPAATPVKATAMLTEMVARRALITSPHAPSTEPDALGWLLEHLETAAASKLAPIAELVAELKEIHALLKQHNHAPTDQSRAIRADVAARMRRLARTRRHPVAVDLRLDASIVLPADVAREAERAALVLARVSAHSYGTPTWRDYHRRCVDRTNWRHADVVDRPGHGGSVDLTHLDAKGGDEGVRRCGAGCRVYRVISLGSCRSRGGGGAVAGGRFGWCVGGADPAVLGGLRRAGQPDRVGA